MTPDGPLERVADSPLTLPALLAGGLLAVALLTGGLPTAAAVAAAPDPVECAVTDCTDGATGSDTDPADVLRRIEYLGDPPQTVTCHACSCTGCGTMTPEPPNTTVTAPTPDRSGNATAVPGRH